MYTTAIVGVSAFAVSAMAQTVGFGLNVPATVQGGQTVPLSYHAPDAASAVDIQLLKGCPDNCVPVPGNEFSATGDAFSWNVSPSLPSECDYGFSIKQGSKSDYSNHFCIAGSSSSASPSATSSAPAYASSSASASTSASVSTPSASATSVDTTCTTLSTSAVSSVVTSPVVTPVSTPASVPAYSVPTPASVPGYSVPVPASVPGYSVPVPASVPGYSVPVLASSAVSVASVSNYPTPGPYAQTSATAGAGGYGGAGYTPAPASTPKVSSATPPPTAYTGAASQVKAASFMGLAGVAGVIALL